MGGEEGQETHGVRVLAEGRVCSTRSAPFRSAPSSVGRRWALRGVDGDRGGGARAVGRGGEEGQRRFRVGDRCWGGGVENLHNDGNNNGMMTVVIAEII